MINLSNFAQTKLAAQAKNYLLNLCRKVRQTTYGKEILYQVQSFLDNTLMIALTYQCQCSCKHCGVPLYPEPKDRELNREEIIKLIIAAKKFKMKAIYFTGGEPFLCPELLHYIHQAKQLNLIVNIDTNGLLLTKEKVKQLKQLNVDDIGISLDGASKDTHDKLRGAKELFDKAVNGIKYCKQYNLSCFISTYASKENIKNGELANMVTLANKLNVEMRIMSPICSGQWLNSDEEKIILSPQEIILMKQILKPGLIYWERRKIDRMTSCFFCSSLQKKLTYVTAYGDVQPCCHMPLIFGNIRKESLEEIMQRMWNSKIFRDNKNNQWSDCPTNDKHFRKIYKNKEQNTCTTQIYKT